MPQNESEDGLIDRLQQTIVIARAVTLLAGYWPARWAPRQPVVEGLREE